MRTALLLLAALAAGCPNKTPQAPPDLGHDGPAVEALRDQELPRLSDASDPEEVSGCQTAADCVVSCRVDGSCCDQLCACTNVYSRSFLERLETQRTAECPTARCPIASCMPPRGETVAECVENRCVAVFKPFPELPVAPLEGQPESP
jgi:hypothetical protein